MYTNDNGSHNISLGYQSLYKNISGNKNIAVGSYALYYSNYIGDNFNIAIGDHSSYFNTTGARNTSIGAFSLYSNSTGNFNIGIGYYALYDCTSSNNTAVGYSALIINTGSDNTALGYNIAQHLTSGSNNIFIGSGVASAYTSSESKNILINHTGVVGDSGVIRIGTAGTNTSAFISGITGVTTGGAATTVVIDGSGQLGTISSSKRYKENIVSVNKQQLDKLYNLEPVSFNYKGKIDKTFGFIAEDVQQVIPEIVITKADPEQDNKEVPETVQYHVLPALLLGMIKQLKKEKDEEINTLRNELNSLKELLLKYINVSS